MRFNLIKACFNYVRHADIHKVADPEEARAASQDSPSREDSYQMRTSRTSLAITPPAAPPEETIFEWKCPKEVFSIYAWPMRMASVDSNGEPNNKEEHLCAKGGVLDKYDAVFGGRARHIELTYFATLLGSDTDWWGHHAEAAIVSCLLKKPIHSVQVGDQTFSPREIEGLLCLVSESLTKGARFEGDRYVFPGDGPSLSPADFLNKVILGWQQEPTARPFALDPDWDDVGTKPEVYNKGTVFRSDLPPLDFDTSQLPTDAVFKFYRAELTGANIAKDAPNNRRIYRFWIAENDGDNPRSGWIRTKDAAVIPGFAWQCEPRGDLENKENWVTSKDQPNPQVRAEDVYSIYIQSIRPQR